MSDKNLPNKLLQLPRYKRNKIENKNTDWHRICKKCSNCSLFLFFRLRKIAARYQLPQNRGSWSCNNINPHNPSSRESYGESNCSRQCTAIYSNRHCKILRTSDDKSWISFSFNKYNIRQFSKDANGKIIILICDANKTQNIAFI